MRVPGVVNRCPEATGLLAAGVLVAVAGAVVAAVPGHAVLGAALAVAGAPVAVAEWAVVRAGIRGAWAAVLALLAGVGAGVGIAAAVDAGAVTQATAGLRHLGAGAMRHLGWAGHAAHAAARGAVAALAGLLVLAVGHAAQVGTAASMVVGAVQVVGAGHDAGGATPRGPPLRVSRRRPCPVCGDTDWCYFSSDGTAIICMRVGDRAAKELPSGGWLHRLDGATTRSRPPLAAIPGGQADRRDPDHLDRVYRRLLGILLLSPADREALRARGMKAAEIDAGLYRSGPGRERGTLARRLLEDLGDDALRGVPGCYVDAGRYGDYWSLRAATGILVPVRDEQDRIIGCQVRRSGDGPGPRYVWWSTKDMRGGASPGAPLGWFGDRAAASPLWATEGPLKAAIAANRLQARVVAVPGVGTWRSSGLAERVRAGGYAEVVIAYDVDAASNVQVAREAHALCEALVTSGVRVAFAAWDPAAGKGIDDLLVGGGQPEIISPRAWEDRLDSEVRRKAIGRGRRVLRVPAEDMPPPAPPQRVYTLEQARQALPAYYRRAIQAPQGAVGRLVILEATTGVGKTTALREALEEVVERGTARVLVLMRSHEAIADALAGIGPRLQAAMVNISTPDDTDTTAVRMAGRSGDPTSPAYCARIDQARQYGEARHSVNANLCRGAGPKNGECPFAVECPYLQLRRKAEAAQIVFAVYTSYVNASDDILSFDVILIDEDMIPSLLETSVVTLARISEWRDVAANLSEKGHDYQQHMTFLAILEAAIQGAGQQSPGSSLPALPRLREAAAAQRIDLDAMVRGCLRDETDKQGRYGFERPCQVCRGQAEIVPLRLLRDLYETIETEERTPRPDTRVRLERLAGAVPTLVLRQPFAPVMEALAAKQVVVSDATPSPLWSTIRPGAETVRIDVPQHLEITQVYDRLLTVPDQRDPATRAMVQAIIQREASACQARGGEAVILTRKAMAPGQPGGYVAADGAEWGWLGNHSRGLNRWEHCDTMLLVGYYQQPLEAIRAQVEALRWAEPVLQAPARERRVYRHREDDGAGWARYWDRDRDVLVQAVLHHGVEAEPVQVIGRLRGVNGDLSARAKRVILLTGAVTSLQVDHLVRLADLAGRGGAREQRTMPAACAERRDAANAARRTEAETRAREAAERIAAAGHPVTVAAVRAASGVRYAAAKAAVSHLLPVIEGVVRQQSSISINDTCRTTAPIEQNDDTQSPAEPCGETTAHDAIPAPVSDLAASVACWADARCRRTTEHSAPLDYLLADYREWAQDRVSSHAFCEALEDIGATVHGHSVVVGVVLLRR